MGRNLYARAYELDAALRKAAATPRQWRCSVDLANDLARVAGLGTLVWGEAVPDAMQETTLVEYPEWWPADQHYGGAYLCVFQPPLLLGTRVVIDPRLPPNSLLLDAAHHPAPTARK